jgi:hypothetical protein
VDLSAHPVTVGRDEACDLVVSDEFVSARHAQLRWIGGTQVEVTDLSSTNGTYVKGDRLAVPALVSPGTRVMLGRITSVTVEPGPLDAPPGAPAGLAGSSAAPWPSGPPSPPTTPMGPAAPLGVAPPPAGGWPAMPTGTVNAGPIAGGNVDLSGQHVAGRDLHYHEGFRIRSKMRPGARRLLWVGILLLFAGWGVAFAGIASFNQSIFDADENTDFSEFGTPFMVAVGGMGIGVIGIVCIVIALVMRRDKIEEPIVRRAR